MKRLGVCADCADQGDQPTVHLVDHKINERDEWGFTCPHHGPSRVVFLEILPTVVIPV
jgi:hypothetical protein